MDSHDWVFEAMAAGEPGLIFDVPEYRGTCHDYEPQWDYVVDEQPDPELFQKAVAAAKTIYARTKTPFECWAVKFTDDEDQNNAVAMYINGTCGYPVILLDLEKHRGYEDQFYKSIDHELKHAIQESEGRDFDEDEAEDDF